jgi:hypothetical protein
VAFVALFATPATSQILIATETGRGEYEGGVFTAGMPEFRYRIEIDEAAKKARLTESVRLVDGTMGMPVTS